MGRTARVHGPESPLLTFALFSAFAAPSTPVEITLIAGGDVLPHRRVKASARTFGWTTTFAGIQPLVAEADIAFANLESPVAPDHHKGIHGEVFNAPASLVDGLAAAGFDVLSMANNHVWDQGTDGMLETHGRVLKAGMSPVGAGPTCAAAREPVVREVNGVKVAFLALVDLLNADLRTTEDAPCVFVPGPPCVEDCLPDRDALFFRADPEQLRAAVHDARSRADLVVVSFHWGNEYRTSPLPEYRELASILVGAGADVVLGHHPHVLQPIERVEAGGRSGIVAYSLGNLVSDMGRTYDPAVHPVRKGNTRDGVLLQIDATVGPEGVHLVPTVHPTWTRHTTVDGAERIDVVLQSTLPEPLRAIRAPHVTTVLGPAGR